jgi:hypothetical protein
VETAVGTGVHEFELTDANGKTWKYLVQEHPAEEGMEMLFELIGLGAPTVLGGLAELFKSEDMLSGLFDAVRSMVGPESASTATSRDWSEFAQLIGQMDVGKVGREITFAVATGKAPKLVRRLLSRTHRNGKLLKEDGAFNVAYQANYWEMLAAVREVCRVNRFFPQLSTLPISLGARTTETTQPPAA